MAGVQRAGVGLRRRRRDRAAQQPRRPRRHERHHASRPPTATCPRRSSAQLRVGPLPRRGHRALPDRRARRDRRRSASGISSVAAQPQVWIGDRYCTVVGILRPVTLDCGIDRAALDRPAGRAAALRHRRQPARRSTCAPTTTSCRPCATSLGERPPTRSTPRRSRSAARRTRSRPSAAAKGAFTSLLLGLGAVALLVGGVGIANVMVISRPRAPLGDRAAPRARRDAPPHQRRSSSPSRCCSAALGGVAGALLGAVVTGATRRARGSRPSSRPRPSSAASLAALRHRRGRRPVSVDARGAAVADRGAAHRLGLGAEPAAHPATRRRSRARASGDDGRRPARHRRVGVTVKLSPSQMSDIGEPSSRRVGRRAPASSRPPAGCRGDEPEAHRLPVGRQARREAQVVAVDVAQPGEAVDERHPDAAAGRDVDAVADVAGEVREVDATLSQEVVVGRLRRRRPRTP